MISTDNNILTEYDSYIKLREAKNVALLQESVDKIGISFLQYLSYPIFRNWFSVFINEAHADKNGLLSFIDLFYKTMMNREVTEERRKAETTLIFIEPLYETIEKARKRKASLNESEQSDTDSQFRHNTFQDEFISIMSPELWALIQAKIKELRASLNPEDSLISEVFDLLQLANERLLSFIQRYFEEFYYSELFRRQFSHNYMRKSGQSPFFDRPQLRMEIRKIDKIEKLGEAGEEQRLSVELAEAPAQREGCEQHKPGEKPKGEGARLGPDVPLEERQHWRPCQQ